MGRMMRHHSAIADQSVTLLGVPPVTTHESLVYKGHYRSFRQLPLAVRVNAKKRIDYSHPKEGSFKGYVHCCRWEGS